MFLDRKYIRSSMINFICSSEVTSKYFEMLSEEDINKLYHVYENDFKLFNYTYIHANFK